jgi:hypothetical protein
MTTETAPQPAYRPEEIDESSFVRYLIAGLGVASVGLGAGLALRRPRHPLVAVGVVAAGVALVARGVRGQWPRLFGARAAADTKATAEPDTEADAWSAVETAGAGPAAEDQNQGEGNRTAARAYNADLRHFIDDGRVAPAARSAAAAVDGPEAAGLRAAEAAGKQSPTNGRH